LGCRREREKKKEIGANWDSAKKREVIRGLEEEGGQLEGS
jgi:hypothetical protein